MLQRREILVYGRLALGVVLLGLSALIYLLSILPFLALLTDNSAKLHTAFIVLGYALLLGAATLEFVGLRFALRNLKRSYIALACLLPMLLVGAVSVETIQHRNFTMVPGHRHASHHWIHCAINIQDSAA